jgi:hypothetical protein
MNFLFHVPFFCTAAEALAEILTFCFVNIEFREHTKVHPTQSIIQYSGPLSKTPQAIKIYKLMQGHHVIH